MACMAAVLVSTILYTQENLLWTAFLTGILLASILAEAARASRSEWVLMRRTAQLAAIKDKLGLEAKLRISAEGKIAEVQGRLRLLDEALLTMIVLVDPEGYCRYHNCAFRDWLHLKAELIYGRHLRDLLGSKAYAGIATAVKQSLDGQSVRYEHVQEMPNGAIYRLSVEQIPQFDNTGRVSGFYFLAEDVTRRGDLTLANGLNSGLKIPAEKIAKTEVKAKISEEHELFLDVFGEQISGRHDAGEQFIAAIQGGEFCLYCQLISALPIDSGKTSHYEILIRLMEEESGVIAPGAFFPWAEINGLMPYLDRWVVQHVLEWAVVKKNTGRDANSMFFINIAMATIGDPEFPVFLQTILKELALPGSLLCFEVPEQDLAIRGASAAEFIRRVRQCGCRVALSGFGRDGVSFDQIRGFQVDFLKIDGNTILNMLSNPVDLAKVISIDRVAKKIGVQTVAELVESDEITARLNDIGVDFVQGFGISRPRSLGE
jgi:PAS domain S-box-containing protein